MGVYDLLWSVMGRYGVDGCVWSVMISDGSVWCRWVCMICYDQYGVVGVYNLLWSVMGQYGVDGCVWSVMISDGSVWDRWVCMTCYDQWWVSMVYTGVDGCVCVCVCDLLWRVYLASDGVLSLSEAIPAQQPVPAGSRQQDIVQLIDQVLPDTQHFPVCAHTHTHIN